MDIPEQQIVEDKSLVKNILSKNHIIAGVIILAVAGFMSILAFTTHKLALESQTTYSHASEIAGQEVAGKTVSGQVIDIGNSTATTCPSTGQGINNIAVQLTGTVNGQEYNQTATTAVGGSHQDGAFYFSNVPDGIFNVCALTSYPQFHYCNTPRSDGHDPIGTSCAKIDTAGQFVGIRLDIYTCPTCHPPTPTEPPCATCRPTPPPEPTCSTCRPTPTIYQPTPSPRPLSPTVIPPKGITSE